MAVATPRESAQIWVSQMVGANLGGYSKSQGSCWPCGNPWGKLRRRVSQEMERGCLYPALPRHSLQTLDGNQELLVTVIDHPTIRGVIGKKHNRMMQKFTFNASLMSLSPLTWFLCSTLYLDYKEVRCSQLMWLILINMFCCNYWAKIL